MNKTRIKFAAQDAILDAIIDAAEEEDPEIKKIMLEEGARLAARWGVQHQRLPDTRRKSE